MFYNIITLNNKHVALKFDQKNKDDTWHLSTWEYPAALIGIVDELILTGLMDKSKKINSQKIDEIFTNVFTIMNDVKDNINKNNEFGTTGIETTDFGTIQLFDISNTHNEDFISFFNEYESTKRNYLSLG